MICPVYVAHDLSGSVLRTGSGLLERSDAPVGSPRGGSFDQVSGCFGSLRGCGVHSVGSGGVARDRGADVSTLARALRGRRRGGLVGPPAGEGVGPVGSGGSGAGSGSSVSRALRRLHGQALSRAAVAAPRFPVELQLDEDVSAIEGPAGEGQTARRASAQTAAPSAARHDAASGRFASPVAGGPASAGSDRDDGRCDERDSFGLSDRGGWHGLDVPGLARSVRASRPAAEPLHRSGRALFSYDGGGREGGPGGSDAGRTRARASGRPPYCDLFSAGARPLGARLPDLAGSVDQGADAGRD